jgi:phosphopantetheinyl transferase
MVVRDQPPDAASLAALAPDESRRWQGFTSEKRKREWLAGRLCAYACARDILGPEYEPLFAVRDWRLENDANGRPRWSENAPEILRATDISISHGGEYAVAMAAARRLGVDAQPCLAKITRITALFAHAGEEALLAAALPDQDRIIRLTVLWSAKESLRKAAGLPAFLDMRLTDCKTINGGWRLRLIAWLQTAAPQTATVAATLRDNHALAFCLLDE